MTAPLPGPASDERRRALRVAPAPRGGWGGARPGAGRPARGRRPSEPHKLRPAQSARHPVHVLARVVPAIRGLRRRRGYRAIRRALATSWGRADFRIVELEVRTGGLALIVEADDEAALARGMQGFQVAAARHLNRAIGRRGQVFADRYRAEILTSRRAVRRAIEALPARERTTSPQTWLLRVDGGPPPRPPLSWSGGRSSRGRPRSAPDRPRTPPA